MRKIKYKVLKFSIKLILKYFCGYMKRVLLFLLLFFISLSGFSQKNLIITGRVIDKESGEGVSFSHIGICGKAIGTVSNVNGEFEIKIPPYYLHDSICISSIGYKTFRKEIEQLLGIDPLIINLSQEISVLQEVIISDDAITGKRVLEKAINSIPRNYARKSYLLDGYYRDYLKKNNEYISFLEGAFTIQDNGINSNEANSRIRINQLRYNDPYIENYKTYLHKAKDDTLKVLLEGVSPFFWGNEFSNMRYHNPVRNRFESVPFIGEFNNFYNSNYQFDIAYYTYFNDEEVYVLKFKPNELFRYHHVQADGEIYIRVKDHAILRFNYNYYVSKFGDKKKWYELNLEYREYQDKLFLKYISYVNYFKIFTGREIAEVYQYREFFVTDIHYPDFEPVPKDKTINKAVPLHRVDIASDHDFWNTYNAILMETPLKN